MKKSGYLLGIFAAVLIVALVAVIAVGTGALGGQKGDTQTASTSQVNSNDVYTASLSYLPVVQRIPTPTPIPSGVNLLQNPGFEGNYNIQFAGIDTVKSPDNWRAWYVCDQAHGGPGDPGDIYGKPCYAPCNPNDWTCSTNCPIYCNGCPFDGRADPGCFWQLPEFMARNVWDGGDANLQVHGGNTSMRYFTWGRMSQGGAFQTLTISGLTPGRMMEFSIWARAFMCHWVRQDENDWGTCAGMHSNQKYKNMRMSVGIDPWGRTDPYANGVYWNTETVYDEGFDAWWQYRVFAPAQTDTVTVYFRTRPVIEIGLNAQTMEVYIDDASLVLH